MRAGGAPAGRGSLGVALTAHGQLLGLTWTLCAIVAALIHGLAPYHRDVPTALGLWLAGAPVHLRADRVAALVIAIGFTVALLAVLVSTPLSFLVM